MQICDYSSANVKRETNFALLPEKGHHGPKGR